jgi:hypothetical protein
MIALNNGQEDSSPDTRIKSNSFGWPSRVNPFCPKGKMGGLL